LLKTVQKKALRHTSAQVYQVYETKLKENA